jgi:hypothetical protein
MDLKFRKDMGITAENDGYHRRVPSLQHYSSIPLILSLHDLFVVVVVIVVKQNTSTEKKPK